MAKTIEYHPETLEQIECAKLPRVVNAHLRSSHDRKAWAANIRSMLKNAGIEHVSVTTPHYSMAHSVDVRLPATIPWKGEHEQKHAEIDAAQRSNSVWMGYGNYCEICKRETAVKDKLEKIILAAFPDLDDRSDTMTDYFDFCFTID